MRLKMIMLVLALYPALLLSQDTISLELCLVQARENHPRHTDFELYEKIRKNEISKIQTNWYPGLEVNGKASYQSDVIEFGAIPLQGVELPSPSKDQYKISLDLTQKIYDAGISSGQKELAEAESIANKTELEAALWKDQESIIDLYYSYLALNEKARILELSIHELETNEEVLNSAVKRGVSLKTDLKLVTIQKMEIRQDLENLRSSADAVLKVLNEKTGMEISPADSLLLTSYPAPAGQEINRKELDLLEARRTNMERSSDLLTSKRLPVVFAFGQVGYGNPGLNMISDKFDSWYIVGAGLKWNIWDWNSVKNEKENISYHIQMLEHQKQDLKMKFSNALVNQMTEINNHRNNIIEYQKILEMRREITETYHSMLDNGSIRMIDYLKVMNDERRMKIKLSTERILLQRSIAEYLYINGSLTEY